MKRLIIIGCAAMIGILGAYAGVNYYRSGHPVRGEVEVTGKTEVSLFLPSSDVGLKRKSILLDKMPSQIELAEFLIRTLEEEGVIPQDTKILHFSVDREGIIYLDLSREALNIGDSLSEVQVVYSLVNTFLENFRNSKAVQILIEGEPVQTFSGIIYTYLPLTFNLDLVEGIDDKS